MKPTKLILAALFLLPACSSPDSRRTRSCIAAETSRGFLADLFGRLYRQALQRSEAVDRNTVKNLTLGWIARVNPVHGAGTIVGGEGPEEWTPGGVTVSGAILMVDGILYLTAPDHVWAMDARDGRQLWHYYWKTKGGTHIGNRGVGIWRNYLFFETPDNYLVSLDARTGKERWHVEIADFDQQYFSTMAPIIVGDHVLVGTGNDLDSPGFLQSYRSGNRKAPMEVLHRPDESR